MNFYLTFNVNLMYSVNTVLALYTNKLLIIINFNYKTDSADEMGDDVCTIPALLRL